MKAEEAKEKVCPFIQQLNVGTGHQMYGTTSNITCVCDECMAWQWSLECIPNSIGTLKHSGELSKEYGYCARIGQ